jgi:uncharacterized repeat protein (TIGR03803 family)
MTGTDNRSTTLSRLRLEVGPRLLVLGLFLALAPHSLPAQTFTVLYSFTGGVDGGYPYGTLLRDSSGKLYGTTFGGGAHNYGTVFELDLASKEKVLHSFGGPPDGAYPFAGLVRDSQNNLYGTTQLGGNSGCGYPLYIGCGTVFKLDSTRRETVLYRFCKKPFLYCTDGVKPVAGLTRDSAGNLFGIAGLVFELDKSGHETVLSSTFGGGYPAYGALIQDASGNFYDTTIYGGSYDCSYDYGVDCGSVFQLSPSGQITLLYSFKGKPDGQFPDSGLLAGSNGEFYGTTSAGGTHGAGTVFMLNQDSKETLLHSFTGRDGANPVSGVIRDEQGNLYGTTLYGGTHNMGTVYRLSRTGKFTLLHSFRGIDGEDPFADLIMVGSDTLYGTTALGGISGAGTVFKITTR